MAQSVGEAMKKVITCVVFAVLAFCGAFFSVFGPVDQYMEDVLYHHPTGTDGRIRIIKIDDRTMNELGDFSKWERSVYADLIDVLCVSEDVKPSVIAFDILFSSDNGTESDAEFVRACKEHGSVITGFSYVFTKDIISSGNGIVDVDAMAVQDKVLPYPALREVTSQGFVNALMDNEDGVIRNTFLYYDERGGERTLSFCSAIYEAYMRSAGTDPVYPTDKSILPFRYSSGVSEYEAVSLIDVLNGNVPAQAFAGSAVLVGPYAAGMMDAYQVPVDKGQQMYGVEIHANALQALFDGKTLYPVPAWMDGLVAAVIAVALVLLCDKIGVVFGTLSCVVMIAIKYILGMVLFSSGYSSDVLVVPVSAVLIAVCFIILHYYKARMAKKSIEKAFSKYVAPQVVSEIAKNGTYELKLGGENRDVAVLFVDIRGFTPLSESLEPEQVVDILNSYLALTTSCIFRHGGTLDKFIGDATMAVFNAPFDTEDYVYKALLAAWDIVQGGNRIEEKFVERYGKHVGFGVGVNCGPAVVGNIGCDFRMDYTAIGDTVNTAARLESNAPRGTVYISGTVYEHIKDRVTVEEVGEIPLKGKSKGVFVYSVTGVKDYESPSEIEFAAAK